MDEDQINRWGKALLIKIAVITGWVLPVDELLNVLVDQFKKKMMESYANCNPEEVEYAFRNFASEVKDWGKQLNLSLIDEVMLPYLRKRREQSVVEEHAAPLLMLSGCQERMTDFAMLRWLAEEIRFIKTGKPFEMVPLELYEYLDKRGKIPATNAEKFEYLGKAAAWRLGQLQKEVERKGSVDNLRALESFKTMRIKDNFSQREYERLKTIAKKLLFFDLVQKNY